VKLAGYRRRMPKRNPSPAICNSNPEFFERHQALLARLRLPHSRGGSTISLVERQIEVMRERHAALEAKLAELVRVARDNDVDRGALPPLRAQAAARAVAPGGAR
jgi:uncharacterized protein YigA (DUF484 family)